MDASEFEQTVGGHNSHVNFAVLVVVSLGCLEASRLCLAAPKHRSVRSQGYLSMLHCSSRLMEASSEL